jgi:hypothetical protein
LLKSERFSPATNVVGKIYRVLSELLGRLIQ